MQHAVLKKHVQFDIFILALAHPGHLYTPQFRRPRLVHKGGKKDFLALEHRASVVTTQSY